MTKSFILSRSKKKKGEKEKESIGTGLCTRKDILLGLLFIITFHCKGSSIKIDSATGQNIHGVHGDGQVS